MDQIIDKQNPEKHHIFFINKIFKSTSLYCRSYGKLAVSLVKNKVILNSIGKNYDINVNSVVDGILQAEIQLSSFKTICSYGLMVF